MEPDPDGERLEAVSASAPVPLRCLLEGKASLSSLGVLAAHLSEETARPKTRPDEASPPKTRLDEAAGAKKREAPRREARAGSRAFQAPPGAQASRLHLSRYIPSSVRERADYQCEFRGPGGVRCTARTRLEVDHPIRGREGRAARKTFWCSVVGTIFSTRRGSSGSRS